MRAVICDLQGVRVSDDHPEPVCSAGEALVRPSRVLLAPVDAAIAGRAADRVLAPTGRGFSGVLGHQMVGVVSAINLPADAGAALSTRRGWTGKRVVVSPVIVCGQCDLCRRGLTAHCRQRRVMGAMERDGCLSEAVCVPLACLALVPDGIEDDHAALALPLASAAHAANMLPARGRGESGGGKTVDTPAFATVLGDTLLALLTARVLARKNASVRLLSSSAACARVCERWGIKQRRPDEPGRRQDQDVVVDCTGTAQGLRLALQLVRPRGVVLLKSPDAIIPHPAGVPAGEPGPRWSPGVDLTPAVANEVQIVGSSDGPIADGLILMKELLSDLPSLVTPPITRRYRLADALEALDAARGGEALGVLVDIHNR